MRAYAGYVEEVMKRGVFQRTMLLDIPRFADVIIVCVANIRAARDVLLQRDDSILLNAKPGTIIINHTTLDLPTTHELASLASARGLYYLDAPIAGSPELAQTGNITVMVGGDELAFKRVYRIMSKYAHCVEYMGETGKGTATKLIHENLAAVHAVASAEAAVLAKTLGVTDMDKLTRVMDNSLGGSNMFRRNAMYFPEQFRTRGKIATGQTISRMAKNIAILDSDVLSSGMRDVLPLSTASHDIINRCGQAGGHDADITSVLHFLSPTNPNTTIPWDVPVSSPVHTARAEEDASSSSHWETITEFDTHTESTELTTAHTPPRVDPETLSRLYSKAKPKVAEGSVEGKTIGKSGYNPFESMKNQHPAVRRTMETFRQIGEVVDRSTGKASFNGIPMHQRAPSLINPIKARDA
eukprot:TRINITY_DN34079_c0_g1_i1.p1 TRINITY_DN34079_c0_g1~~TRINITY_DN34079_c0_g1_i1.p1  ORF type:complete len:437 (+),score=66.53 TRINITY_DN34079_c0_g1_i1:76-1311(+)